MIEEYAFENAILAALPLEEFESLLPDLEPVSLPVGAILYNSGDEVEYVYFPGKAVVSLVTHSKDGLTVEIGIIAQDGMVGIPVLLGDDIAFEEARVRIAGSATRLKSAVLKSNLTAANSPLLTLLLLYTRSLMKQVMQTAVCNRLHSENERLSRWLLMCRDRVESDELPLNHDFVSDVLSLRPENTTKAISELQGEGLIRCSSGVISILNRNGLERVACDCYGAIALKPLRTTNGPISANVN
ncbi:MAG TPA: Crp/Fnr family transcriptional regulator [Pyrinomonadaceae bacterium]